MLLLVSKAHPTHELLRQPGLGRLVIPRDYRRVRETAALGIPWAADNAAFSGFDARKFRGMLNAIDGVPGCLFVACPDVVGDARATLRRFARWRDAISGPVALVAQDGLTSSATPWDEIAALFIGGSTEWKLGEQAAQLVAEARERGRWVHMGRVNTARRFRYAASIGCDSVDGSKFSAWTSAWLADGVAMAQAPTQVRMLP